MAEPIRFVCSGLGKAEIQRAVQDTGGSGVEATIMSDIEGARAVKQGKADYFIGSCATGQGGALASAIAVLGYGNCTLISGARAPSPQDVEKKVTSKDWKAFGVRVDQVNAIVPTLVNTLLAERR